jgi:uncharacterized protein YndB with AHSA1/START domain
MTANATISTTRLLPYPPESVFAAFSDPAVLASWWGPSGFTNEFETFEFRPGGTWRFVMVGPDGARYKNESVFTQLTPPSCIDLDHLSAPRFTLTVTLTAASDGTLVQWTGVFSDPAVAAAIRHIAEPANEQNLDRLSAALAAKTGPA